jgi:HlyD family secretion protein
MSSALQAATSRIASAPKTASSGSAAASSSASAPSAMGADGLGSTSSELVSGGGLGGGGGDDFNLTLLRLAKPGSQVRKGDPVAEFDRQYMQQRLEDYNASVMQAEADLTKLKADLAVAKKIKEQDIATAKGDCDKARLDMKTLPVLSQLDTARTKLALSEAEAKYKQLLADVQQVEISQQSAVRNAEIELQQTRIELKRAEANANRMVLKAPINGLAVMQTIWRGGDMAQVKEGDQLWPGMMFMTVVDTKSMVVNASVNQVDVESLRIGQKANVRFDAYPDLVLPARVYSIGGVPKQGGQRASYVKEIAVRLKLERTDPRVIPDLTVSADVLLQSEENAAVVPLPTVFRDGQTHRPFVYVRAGDAWTRRDIELGLANNVAVAVHAGLKPGEIVALSEPSNPGQSGTK